MGRCTRKRGGHEARSWRRGPDVSPVSFDTRPRQWATPARKSGSVAARNQGEREGKEGGGHRLYSHGHGQGLKGFNREQSRAESSGKNGLTSCWRKHFFLFFFLIILLNHIAYNFCFIHQKNVKQNPKIMVFKMQSNHIIFGGCFYYFKFSIFNTWIKS